MKISRRNQVAWRILTRDGIPEFILAKPLLSSGVMLGVGDPFPTGIPERRLKLLYQQHKINPVTEPVKTPKPKVKKVK